MTFSEAELLAYLDEALPPEQASEIENALRVSSALRLQLSVLLERRDQGGHTLGEIWRRGQLSCLNRTDLARYLSGQAQPDERDYVEFHVGVIRCPVCDANLQDLRQLGDSEAHEQEQRRRRFFESSARGLRLGE